MGHPTTPSNLFYGRLTPQQQGFFAVAVPAHYKIFLRASHSATDFYSQWLSRHTVKPLRASHTAATGFSLSGSPSTLSNLPTGVSLRSDRFFFQLPSQHTVKASYGRLTPQRQWPFQPTISSFSSHFKTKISLSSPWCTVRLIRVIGSATIKLILTCQQNPKRSQHTITTKQPKMAPRFIIFFYFHFVCGSSQLLTC